MLKLKKVNLAQKAASSIQTEDQTHFVEQSTLKESLSEVLKQQPYTHTRILTHLSNPSFSSISSAEFVKILASAINPSHLHFASDVSSCLQILQKLISLPHNPKEVKTLIKKQKSIDSLLLLSLLWSARSNQQCWKYVAYMIECFPAEMVLSGKEYVQKWEEYFADCQEKKRLNEELTLKIKQNELFERLTKKLQNNHEKGFVDTYINL